ncbi:MAG TPA: periplasmic heavy metal sensor [Reyranella sp.]|jgi:Spy/CpxP family protein refolding chaperone
MSSRLIQVLLALSLLLNTFVLVGFVYRSWIEPPPFERHAPPPQGQRPSALETMTHDLNLDDSQRQALRGAFDQYATSRRERLREIQKLREQLAIEYKKPSIDMTRVDGLIDQLTKLRADMQKETLRSFTQLETQLKPEQRERMHQILAERLASPPVGRPQGGGAGPGPGRPPPQ